MEECLQYAKIKPVTNQSEAHPHYSNEELRKYCEQKGIVFTAYSSLGKVFENQTTCIDEPIVHKIAKKYNKTPAQILYRWGIQRGFLILPKSTTPSRIIENAQIFDFVISDGDMAEITSLGKVNDKKNKPSWCSFD
jgi:diketogulonate reductase-like aldo/keto reductase